MYAALAVGVALWLQYRGASQRTTARAVAQAAAATLERELGDPLHVGAPSLFRRSDVLVAAPAHQFVTDMARERAFTMRGTTPDELEESARAQCPPPPTVTCCIDVTTGAGAGGRAPSRLLLWIAVDESDRPTLVGYCTLSATR